MTSSPRTRLSLHLAPLALLTAFSTSCAAIDEFQRALTQNTPTVAATRTVSTAASQAIEAQPAQLVGELAIGAVTINGRTLTEMERNALGAQYGVPPLPGGWWYDPTCGAFGPVGGPIAGVMKPGHDFGPLDPNASHGTSGVYVNGRHLTAPEAMYLTAITGGQQGRYWVDAQGNFGYTGSRQPMANLMTLAAQAGANGGGGGDNFWSTGIGAGNWNDQGQGYVSVPGHGPIGYGF